MIVLAESNGTVVPVEYHSASGDCAHIRLTMAGQEVVLNREETIALRDQLNKDFPDNTLSAQPLTQEEISEVVLVLQDSTDYMRDDAIESLQMQDYDHAASVTDYLAKLKIIIAKLKEEG